MPKSFVEAEGRQDIERVIVDQSDFDMLAAAEPDAMHQLKVSPWSECLLIEADPDCFLQRHI